MLLLSCSVVPNSSLQSHRLQHARPPCPSPSPRVCSCSCPLIRRCHLDISSSVIPLSCLQSLPVSGAFLMSRLFPSGVQSIGVSASASVLPMNTQGWFPLVLTGFISFCPRYSQVFSTVQKLQFFGTQTSLWSYSLIHTRLLEKKIITLTTRTFVGKEWACF